MAEENKGTGGQESVIPEAEPRPYELKQVQVRLRLSEAGSIYSSKEITNHVQAAEVMSDVLAQMDREYVCVVNLDIKNRPINFNIVSIGDIDAAIAPPQNIFKSAILSNSARIMLMHSHPSGDLTPSMEDMILTKRVYQVGTMMNIPLVDHVIVAGGTGQTYSLLENHPELFRIGAWTAKTQGLDSAQEEASGRMQQGIDSRQEEDPGRMQDRQSVPEMGKEGHVASDSRAAVKPARSERKSVLGALQEKKEQVRTADSGRQEQQKAQNRPHSRNDISI